LYGEIKIRIAIKNGLLIQHQFLKRADILVDGEKIIEIGRSLAVPRDAYSIDARNLYVSPGFIDTQVNGGAGYSFLDNTEEAFERIRIFHAMYGTTSLLPTAVAFPIQETRNFLGLVKTFRKIHPNILGAHLNGPLVSEKKRGAMNQKYILPPTLENLKMLISGFEDTVRIITLAPEVPGIEKLIPVLKKYGIVASIGHSDATYEEARKAIDMGITHFTHFFNAMRGFHHREPGVVGAALASKSTTVGLIADGIHVHPAAIRLLVKLKGVSAICLVTDSIRATGMKDGAYESGGVRVFVKGKKAETRNGTLAGSTLTMIEAIRNFKASCEISLPQAVQAATLNPARLLKINNIKGTLDERKDADIVVFDENFRVHYTIIRGEIVYRRNS